MTKKKRKQILQLSGLHIFYIILCLLALVPILYALNLSFERGSGALSSGLSLFPKEFTLDNYKNILTQKPFLRWFYNSAVLSFFTMVIAIGFAMVSSYAFSRYRFKGRNGILKLLLLLNAFPQILSMFALFRLLKQMNMLDTKLGLVIIYAGSMCIFSIWNMKGYFDTIPVEIEEAAMIDGCNPLQTFFGVVMPILKPTAITVAILNAMWIWNDYLLPYLVIGLSTNYKTIPVVVQYLVGSYGAKDLGAMMALLVLSVIPIIVFYLTCQKYIIEGVVAGAVKG